MWKFSKIDNDHAFDGYDGHKIEASKTNIIQTRISSKSNAILCNPLGVLYWLCCFDKMNSS